MSKVRVDLQSNVCYVTPDRSLELPLADVPRAVKRAGFVPGEMLIRARGTFEERRYRIRGWRESFAVKGESAPPAGEVELRARVDYSEETLVLVPLQ